MKQKIWQLFQCTPKKKDFVAAVQYSKSKQSFTLNVVKYSDTLPNFEMETLNFGASDLQLPHLWRCRISILNDFVYIWLTVSEINKITKSKVSNLVPFLGKIFSTKRCNAFFVKRRSMWITWNLNKGANSSSWSILKLIKMQKGNVARKSSKLRDFYSYCFLSSKSLTKGNFKKFKEIYQIFKGNA